MKILQGILSGRGDGSIKRKICEISCPKNSKACSSIQEYSSTLLTHQMTNETLMEFPNRTVVCTGNRMMRLDINKQMMNKKKNHPLNKKLP